MPLITHVLMGWVASTVPDFEPRDRALVTAAAFAPDLDGIGIIAELATKNSADPLWWWTEYHHVLGHNLVAGIVLCGVAFSLAKRKMVTALMVFGIFHLHLLGDLMGSRAPDGYDWPIPYRLPFNDAFHISWSGQWALNAWPNMAFTIFLLVITFYLAWLHGFSVLERVSKRLERILVATLRQRFGEPVPN